MKTAYDAIIVGARCAGSPTAMLLARKGYRVLAGRPRDVPERHGVLACRASTGRRRPRTVGTDRSADGDRMSADSHLRVRFRSLHALRVAGHRQTRRSRTAPGGRSSTNCSSTQRLRPARKFERASRWRKS